MKTLLTGNKTPKSKKSSFQSFWKETFSKMDNQELIQTLKNKKAEQVQVLAVSYSMALGNVIQLIKRELNDRGLDWLSISQEAA